MTTLTLAKALNAGLRRALADDDKVVLMGEDIGTLGGVFRVTDGLQAEFGAHRVVDTPLVRGRHRRHRGRARLPRLPAGHRDPVRRVHLPGLRPDRRAGREAALPHARQRAHADHDPRAVRRRHRRGRAPLRVARGVLRAHRRACASSACSNPQTRYMMLRQAIASDDPVLFFEPKRRYHVKGEVDEPRASPTRRRWASRRRSRTGRDVTLVTYGALVQTARDAALAAADDGISIEVIDLRSLSPVDYETVEASVRRTGRLVITHEAGQQGGVGAEIAASITERCFEYLEAAPVRVTGHDIPYPPAKLERPPPARPRPHPRRRRPRAGPRRTR